MLLHAGLLFDWLYPAHFPTLRACLEAWADSPDVTTAMLKFMAEFALNKTQRLTFDSSSPNGILLFREVSKVGFPIAYRGSLACLHSQQAGATVTGFSDCTRGFTSGHCYARWRAAALQLCIVA